MVKERCQALLDADEEIQYIFPASSTVRPATSFVMAHFIIVVTAKAVSIPRPYLRLPLAGHFEVDDEYVPVINAADAEVIFTDSLPPDPFPDL